tara:strand:- start:27 stop:401 length:375 start_codon:yes stop_codon:yes gene_type:complete
MEIGKRTFRNFKDVAISEEEINKKVELTTMMFFQIVQLDGTARELRDLSTQQEKKELNNFINLSKKVIKTIEKKFKIDVDDSDEEIDDIYYNMQEVLHETTKRQMNAFRRGLEKQFLDTTKFFK